jgi:hypothetical protein
LEKTECEGISIIRTQANVINLMVALLMNTPQTCCECPMARHLYGDRFACGNSLSLVVRSGYLATEECHSALLDCPSRWFHPLPIDLKGVEPESICDKIGLDINIVELPDGKIITRSNPAAVSLAYHTATGTSPNIKHRFGKTLIGRIHQSADLYYCERFPHLTDRDPFKVALLMVNPDLIYGVAEEIIAERNAMPNYTSQYYWIGTDR